jgi:hypothetical protein
VTDQDALLGRLGARKADCGCCLVVDSVALNEVISEHIRVTGDRIDAVDLDAIEAKWLQQCGPCDGGLPMECSCPAGDPRPVIALLVDAVRSGSAR